MKRDCVKRERKSNYLYQCRYIYKFIIIIATIVRRNTATLHCYKTEFRNVGANRLRYVNATHYSQIITRFYL